MEIKDKKIPQNFILSNLKIRCVCITCLYIVISIFSILLLTVYFNSPSPLPSPKTENKQQKPVADNKHNEINSHSNIIEIPKIIHQMWKDNEASIPHDLKRWRKGCQEVNSNYEFKLYFDSDLKDFVIQNYPEYLDFFNSLKGVYMADMARVLLVYHYGGIYMDLDFYCVRNFDCMIQNIETKYDLSDLKNEKRRRQRYLQSISQNSSSLSSIASSLTRSVSTKAFGVASKKNKISVDKSHILIVPNEPLVQSLMYHSKTRTIIQDFFAATPKHPFFKWILDERNHYYGLMINKNKLPQSYPFPFPSSISEKSLAELPYFMKYHFNPKGPFSYSFDKDLDRYYYYMHHHLHDRKKLENKSKKNITKPHVPKTVLLDIPNSQYKHVNYPHLQYPHLPSPALDYAWPAPTATPVSAKLTALTSTTKPFDQRNGYGYVIEISEHVLHPLIDSTNSKLHSFCTAVDQIYDTDVALPSMNHTSFSTVGTLSASDPTPLHHTKRSPVQFIREIHASPLYTQTINLKALCKQIRNSDFFVPDQIETVAVHMWSHVYLGWGFIRSYLSSRIYRNVENMLPATLSCSSEFN